VDHAGPVHSGGRRRPQGRLRQVARSSRRPAEWPTAEEIVNAFGCWADALRAARVGGVPVDVSARRMLASGQPFEPEEMIACVRDWIDEVDPERPALMAYVRWARQQMLSRDRRLPRYWRSPDLAYDRFGGWPALLAQAGYRWRPRGLEVERRDEITRGYVDAYLAEHGCLPTSQNMNGYLRRVRAGGGQTGWLPWPAAVCSEHGGWLDALCTLDYLTAEELAARRARRGRTERQLLEFVVEALAALGEDASSTAYGRWAAGQRSAGRLEVPTFPALYGRLGTWVSIRTAAIRLRDGGEAA
jgi:hypothetical protein